MATAAAAAAAAAALYNSVPQNHFLYSQWLATRNTSALFGLQGERVSERAIGKNNCRRCIDCCGEAAWRLK